MINNLKEGNVYWIKHREISSRREGHVSKPVSDKTEVSLVKLVKFYEKENAYFFYPLGRGVCFGLSVKDILDAVIVENPFKDARGGLIK